jgi:hypothetical protein
MHLTPGGVPRHVVEITQDPASQIGGGVPVETRKKRWHKSQRYKR